MPNIYFSMEINDLKYWKQLYIIQHKSTLVWFGEI